MNIRNFLIKNLFDINVDLLLQKESAFTEEICKLQTQLAQIKEDKRRLSVVLTSREKSIESDKETIQILHNNLGQLFDEKEKQKELVASAKDKIENLKKEYSILQESIENLQSEIQLKEVQINGLNTELQTKDTLILGIQTELQDSRMLQMQNNQLIDNLSQENIHLKKSHNLLENQILACNNEITRLKTEVDKLDTERHDFEVEQSERISQLQCNIDNLNATIDNKQIELDDVRNKLQEEQQKFISQLNDISKELEQKNEENDSLQNELMTIKNRKAIWLYQVQLSVTDNLGGTVSGSGEYQENSTVVIEAIADEDFEFVSWNDGNLNAKREFVLNSDLSLEAAFEKKKMSYNVTLLSNPEDAGALNGNGLYEEGSVVRISAKPNDGFVFEKWSDGNKEFERTIEINDNVELIASFSEEIGFEEEFNDDEFNFDDEHYNDALQQAETLSIKQVYDTEEEKTILAEEFFSRSESELIHWRRRLQEDYLVGAPPRLVCKHCGQAVKISGRKFSRGRVCFFQHFANDVQCPWKTESRLSRKEIEAEKYCLVQESFRHKRLKEYIAQSLKSPKSLKMGIHDVLTEHTVTSDIPGITYRRPDVSAKWNNRNFVFELQLSTTFISVIVERDIFYRLNNYFIIWVFNFDDNQEYVNLSNLMCRDIYYANKRNIFIVNEEAKKRSQQTGELILCCRWLDEYNRWSEDVYVGLSDLKIDEENGKVYYYDAQSKYELLHPEEKRRRENLEKTKSDLLNYINNKSSREEEKRRREKEKLTKIQRIIYDSGDKVERFLGGNKRYGFRYKNDIIIPTKPGYKDAEEIQENGYAKVTFNRKYGLVDRCGNEVLHCEHSEIKVVNKYL